MFCSACGISLASTDLFCSVCGKRSQSHSASSETTFFRYIFSSSLFLGGNVFTPDRIILDETGVTYERRNKYLIGIDRSFLSYKNISYVKIDRGLINASIIISSRGSRGVKANNFSISNAKKIEKIIKENLI